MEGHEGAALFGSFVFVFCPFRKKQEFCNFVKGSKETTEKHIMTREGQNASEDKRSAKCVHIKTCSLHWCICLK